MLKITKSLKKVMSFVIITIFITSAALIKVEADSSTDLCTISRSGVPASAKVGDTFDVTYTITPKPIPVQQNTSKKDIVLVIDTSGSMNDAIGSQKKINTMKTVAKNFIDKFNNQGNFNIGLVEYSSYACKVNDILPVSTGSGAQTLKSSIDSLQVGGATNTGDGIRVANVMLDNDTSSKEKYIILMTDGVATSYSREKNNNKTYSRYFGGYVYSDDYLGSYMQPSIDHDGANRGYTLDNGKYVTYNGVQTTTDSDALNYAKNVVGSMIKNDETIKSFMVVGFSSDANSNSSSNGQIVGAAGGYNDTNNNFIKKGQYYSAADANTLQNLYNQFAANIITTINGTAAFQETFSNNLQVVGSDSLPYGLQINGNVVSGDINIQYTLNSDKTQYTANPVQFKITYKVNSYGVCSWGKGGNSSFVQMSVSTQTQTKYFQEQNLQVSDITAQVSIEVSDASGIRDKYTADSSNNSERLDKFLNPSITLLGDSYASINFQGNDLDFFQYQFIEAAQNPQTMPTTGWQDISLTQQTINDDVVTDQQGYLNWRGYDVNHMITLSDTTNWSNPEQVFKYPYAATSYKAASYSSTPDDYGQWEDIVLYTVTNVNNKVVTVNKRWITNSIFMNNMNIGGDYKEASKFWGYIKVPSDGDYTFGAYSDDGCRGYLTSDGVTSSFVNMFKPQGSTWGTTNNVYHLKADTYYPIYLEYFNWGGWADFRIRYKINSLSWTNVPTNWFYPSKNITPGEYAETVFTGSQGIKFPSEAGSYYIAFRTGKGTITQREGFYGPFVVQSKAKFDLTRTFNAANNTVKIGDTFSIDYKIVPEDIKVSDLYKDGGTPPSTYTVTANNFSYEDIFPEGLTPVNKLNDSQLVINGQKVDGKLDINNIMYTLDDTGTVYHAQPITFSIYLRADAKTPEQYLLDGTKAVITYSDIDNGKSQANFPDLNVNVNGLSSIIKLGAFMKNNDKINYIDEGTNGHLNAVKSIPMIMAVIVDIESSNPEISLSITGSYSDKTITFRKYDLNNTNNTIDYNSIQSITLNSSSTSFTNGSNFSLQPGKEYIIIYSITPNGNVGDSINIDAAADNQRVSQNIILDIQDLPDLH